MTAKWKNVKVLITGGAGFVGSHLADSLVSLGVKEVRVLDDLSRGRLKNLRCALASGRVTFYQGDVRDRKEVLRAAQGCEYLFHLAAWRIHRCEADPDQALEVMIEGTQNVLAASAQAEVRRVVYASSASVYGQATQFPTPETHPPYANDTLYGWSKLLGEGLMHWYVKRGAFSGVCLRFFNVYGPRMDVEGKYTEVMIRWIIALLRGQRPVIHGDGSASYDFVHVRDVVRACILAATSRQEWGIYNVGTGRETSLLELAQTIAHLLGKSDIKPELLVARAPSVSRRCACLKAINRDLGYFPTVSLSDGLADLIRWYCNEEGSHNVQGRHPHATACDQKT